MVGMLIRELRRPEVAARVDQAFAVAVAPDSTTAARPLAESPADPAQFRELLALAGWNADRFAEFAVGEPLNNQEREELLELLRRLKTFDGPQLADWARTGSSFAEIVAAPAQQRGELTNLVGRVTKIARHTLLPELATRLEMPVYFECQMKLADSAGTAMIITSRVPRAWTEMKSIDEPAEAAGVFIKLLPQDGISGEGAEALFVSRGIAWHPRRPQEPFVSPSDSLLGELGMDVGLLDEVRQRRPILGTEREAFYQMLDAAGRVGANQLDRLARRNLESVREQWTGEKNRLEALAAASPENSDPPDHQRLQLAREVASRAADGRYSVAPLFNDAEHQVGELVVLDGTARRVARVDVGTAPDGTPSDVARRFDIDHYYEIDVFTDDSQNNPIVFCVRELPAGFPIGDGLHEPVRIAGFFFKNWSFESRRAEMNSASEMRQVAPLVIGRSPLWVELLDPKTNAYVGYFVAVLFLLVLAAVWVVGWWLAREDRRFVDRSLAQNFSLPEGQSLNHLDLDADQTRAERRN